MKITSVGTSAVVNEGGNLTIEDSYLKSSGFHAVQTFKSGSLKAPQLTILGSSTIYGVYAGSKGTTLTGGTVFLSGGRLLPYAHNNGKQAFDIGGATASTLVYGNNIYIPRVYLENVTPLLKHKYELRPATNTTAIDGTNYNLDLVIRYQTVTYESFGGVSASTGAAPAAANQFFDNKSYYFPDDMVYGAGSGIVFAGWYSDKNYIAGSGPYTHRNPNHKAQYRLAKCYYNGKGAASDFDKAVELLTQAANQGHVSARRLLNEIKLKTQII